jgi:hypothetical protein
MLTPAINIASNRTKYNIENASLALGRLSAPPATRAATTKLTVIIPNPHRIQRVPKPEKA